MNLLDSRGDSLLFTILQDSFNGRRIVKLILDSGGDPNLGRSNALLAACGAHVCQATSWKHCTDDGVWRHRTDFHGAYLYEPSVYTLDSLLDAGADPLARDPADDQRPIDFLEALLQQTHNALNADPENATTRGTILELEAMVLSLSRAIAARVDA